MTINKITINGIEIPLEKVCEECGGVGGDYFSGGGVTCLSCKGTGKQPIYYTPQQIEELTGEKLPDDTAVYLRGRAKCIQPDEGYTKWYEWSLKQLRRARRSTDEWQWQIIIAFPYQPAPPADYRTEANT